MYFDNLMEKPEVIIKNDLRDLWDLCDTISE